MRKKGRKKRKKRRGINTHAESRCRKKGKEDGVRKIVKDKDDSEDQCFMAKQTSSTRTSADIKKKGIMVDAGATSHIVNDIKSSRASTTHSSPIPIQSS